MIPILYEADATNFATYGIGTLTDTISCEVTEERNGVYECVLKYPVTGVHFDEIKEERIVKAKPNDTSVPQAFRIYRITTPLNGIVKIYAQHISYDLIGIPLPICSISSMMPQRLVDQIFASALIPHNFTCKTEYTQAKGCEITKPKSLRAMLGGSDGSLLDMWGGEFEWDNFEVQHRKARGANNGVVIEYGKNLTKLEQDSDISEIYTDILPFAVKTNKDGVETVVTLDENTMPITKTSLTQRKILIRDFTDSFDEGESISQSDLRSKVKTYLARSPLGIETPSITISFETLGKQPEYPAILERVSLCDTVTVKHTDYGISVQQKVIKTVYDSLLEKYISITLGAARSNFINEVSSTKAAIENVTKTVDRMPTLVSAAINNATKLITGQNGGYVILNGDSETSMPYELLILDKPNIADAVNVWRWNVGGLGFSSHGYNGPYETAITSDGQIVADFITTGTLLADIIKAGIISSKDGSSYWNIDTGEVVIKAYATSDALNKAVDDLEGNIEKAEATFTQTANAISARVKTAEGNISSLTTDVSGIKTRVSNVEGDISTLEQTTTLLSASVASKVSSSGGSSSSFGWSLTSSGFYLYSNNKTVMTVTKSGLSVSGSITATAGTIGGFTIASTKLYKTKTAYNNTTAGVYLGTDGIGLGAGTFYVTSAGYLYATSGKIGGMSLTANQMYSDNFILGTVYNANDSTQSFTTLSFGSTSGSTFTATTVLHPMPKKKAFLPAKTKSGE